MPNLHVLELEDRRVLSGLPAAYLSAAKELVLSAGSRANDGQDDTFLVRRQGDDLHVSVNGQEVYGGRLADVARIRVEGSNDRDMLLVDYSGGDPLPVEGAGFNAGAGPFDSADAIMLVGGTLASPLGTVTHQFQGLGAGSVRVSLGDSADQTTSSLSYTGVESIRDATQTQHLVFQDNRAGEVLTLTGGDPSSGATQIVSSHGPRVAFDAPSQSLTIAGAVIDVQGTFRGAHATVDLRAQGDLRVSGAIDVSDSAVGGRGGTIRLSADRIELADGARLDASGEAGGGTVLVGGGFQGLDASVRNASTTHVDANASIRADALGAGNGGTVVIWADDRTSFAGTISARGGTSHGQGGLAEVSGKRWLEFQGLVDLSAALGPSGTLLLDPTTIVIDSAYAATLVAQLEVGNVSLLADEIIVQSAVDASGNSTVGTSLQLHATTITLTNGANLITKEGDLLLDGDVVLDAGVLLSTGSGPGGNLSITGTIDGGGSDLTIEAGSGDIMLGGAVDAVQSLVLNSSGTTFLMGAVGGSAAVGSLTTDGGGATFVSANVTTQGGTQIYDDPVVLTNHVTFTDTGTTGIFFNSTVEGDANGPWNLTVVTTEVLSEIQFNDAVGSGHLIGNLTILNAGGLEIGPDADITVEGAFAQLGPGQVRMAGDITTSGGSVSFASAVTLTGDVSIDTTDGGSVPGDDILFTRNALIDSQDGENNGLTLTAGLDGTVSFNADIGSVTGLGHLIVTSAFGVAFGNDTTLADADLAPLAVVRIDGNAPEPDGFAFDIGSVTAVGPDGISLNGGDGGLISLFTTADKVRFNGAVQLHSDALIDTSGDGIAIEGAEILFEGTIDGTSGGAAENLSLISHTATIEVRDAVGAGVPLGTISLQDDLPESTGAVLFFGAVYAQGLETFSQPYDVDLLGGGFIVDAVEFLNTGGVTLGDGVEDDLTFGNGVTSTASHTSVGGTIRTLALDMQFATVSVIADARLLTAGGNIGFAGSVDSMAGEHFDLELTALSGIVQFSADVGSAAPLNHLVVHSASLIELGSDASPVHVVMAVGGIDLGRTSAIGDILLNGGVGGLLALGTAGGMVRLNGRVELQSDVSINSADGGEPAGAEIRFTSNATIDSEAGETNRLILSAGTDGAVSFNADIGASDALKQLIVTEAKAVAFGNDASAADLDLASVSTVRVDGDPLDPDGFAINIGSVSAIDGEAITLNAGDGETIWFITTGDKVRFNGVLELHSDARIDTSDGGNEAGAEIRFTLNTPIDSQLGESNGLTLTAGVEGTVTFNGDIGTREAPGHLIVTDAQGVVFGGEQLPDFAPLTTVRVGGDALSPDFFFLDLGSVTAIGDGGIVLNGGRDLAGNPLTLTVASASGAMRFNGAVSLWSDVLVDTADAGDSFGAPILFTQNAPIDSQAGEHNDLVLTAGEGNVEFNANLGEQRALDRLEIVQADAGVVFGASDEAEAGGDRAPVRIINADGGIDIGSREVITGGIVLNAGADFGDVQVIALTTAGTDVRMNGPVTLASHVAVDTGAGVGDILFTDDSPIDSEAGEKNDLVLTANSGRVLFNADLGAQQALHWLEVTQADGGVYFGGADVAEEDLGDRGPVRQVVVEIGLNLGSQSLISDGIFFNAGETGEILVLVETGDDDPATSDARLNGPVWLQSDLAIDTSGGSGGIGITFTADTTIDSEAAEHNSLRLNAGPGDVRFYADIGTASGGSSDSRIGRLDVESSSNVWVADTVVQIDAFGDIDFLSSGNVAIGYAPAEDEVTGNPPQPDLDPPNVETTVTGHTVTIRAKGNLTIVDGAALQSHTGMVSNAPPILRPAPDDPNKVLVPGDRVHTITGTMGGNQTLDGGSKDNWERGVNFTLSLFWGDLKTTIIRNIQAGDVIDLEVGENGEIIKLDITHKEDEATGVIRFTLRRHYSLAYLQTVETTVETLMVMSNDENIRLDDVRTANLNETSAVRGIKVAGDLLRASEPIPEYLSPPPLRPSESAAVVLETSTIPPETRTTRYDEARPPIEEGAETLRVWYLVRVLPNGKEDTRHPLSEDVASDPVKLFQSLREMGLPDGRYRIYLEELGFPRRMVYEFYKSGSSLGDPVRERGPGANPVPQAKPESAAPIDEQGASAYPAQSEAAFIADPLGASIASTLTVCPETGPDWLRFLLTDNQASGSTDAWLDGTSAPSSAAGAKTSDAPLGAVVALGSWLCGTLPASPRRKDALASPASGDWSVRKGRHDWNERVDEALEKCPQRALTRGARLQRRLQCRS